LDIVKKTISETKKILNIDDEKKNIVYIDINENKEFENKRLNHNNIIINSIENEIRLLDTDKNDNNKNDIDINKNKINNKENLILNKDSNYYPLSSNENEFCLLKSDTDTKTDSDFNINERILIRQDFNKDKYKDKNKIKNKEIFIDEDLEKDKDNEDSKKIILNNY
jgi:hypothetical protein